MPRIEIYLPSEGDKQEITKQAKEKGFDSVSSYLRDLIEKDKPKFKRLGGSKG